MKRSLGAMCALMIACVLCMGGVASAAGSKAKAPIQGGNGNCGANETGLPVLGQVTFKRKGNVVTVSASLKKGTASTVYNIDVFGNSCTYLGSVGTLTTNKKGAGHGKGSITVPEADNMFFADIDTEGPFGPSNDTPYVSLP